VDELGPVAAYDSSQRRVIQAAGFLSRRGKTIAVILVVLFSALVVGTLAFGDIAAFRVINNTVVSVALVWVMARNMARRGDRDFAVIRVGLLCFGATALLSNLERYVKIEPYGFAILLASLGYVAARRTLKRDEELGEIQKELDLARGMQLSLLPGEFPASPAFLIAARYVPMRSVAGDFYDFVIADARHAGLFIADVSGHGLAAALIASMVKMAAISQRPNASKPAELLAGMNRALFGNTQGQYVTAAYAYLDAKNGELRYAAAGHPAMLLLREGIVLEIAENNLLLAAVAHVDYTEKSVPLERGDRLLLYTDGLVEARSSDGTLFGESSLFAAFQETTTLPPSDAAEAIIARVQQWSAVQEDDLTVLVCDYTAIA
jgi:sigma-B regulation protein RsbU (phosphoserine phosphatase)